MRDAQREMARRVRQVRVERFGEGGVPIVADLMCIPARTWRSFEAGARIPTPALRRFHELTGTSPRWLRTGQWPRWMPNKCNSEQTVRPTSRETTSDDRSPPRSGSTGR